MRRALRPATLVFAAVLVSLAACSSPTAPAPATKVKTAPAVRDDVPPVDTTAKSGFIMPGG